MIILAAKGAGIIKCLEEKAGSILTSLLRSWDDLRVSQAGEAPEINHHQKESPKNQTFGLNSIFVQLQKCKILHCARWIPRMIDEPNICVCHRILGFYHLHFKTNSCECLDACQDDGIQTGREGRLMSFWGIRRSGRESLCPGVCVTPYTHFIHTHLQHKHTHLHVLSLPLWLIVWPPVGSLASCCPVLWEITSLSSWHTRQTVFWLTYAQLLHSSFPASSAPVTARISKCYCILKIWHFL